MNSGLILGVIGLYFAILFIISQRTAKNATQDTFFSGDKESPWYLVAFGMIGASLSGVTFISVPGWVMTSGFGYMQMVLGYLLGYTFIALVLLPLYYRMNLISIYGYLEKRFGIKSYKTGAAFFLISRIIGASFRLFLVAIVFQLIFDRLGWIQVPFSVNVFISIALIYLYTFRGGIKTVVWTDTLQTLFMLVSAGLSIWWISKELNWGGMEMITEISQSSYSKVFQFENLVGSSDHFLKKFLSGVFIAIVMTGLDQDMMQKNLTCRSTKEAQKNMFSFSLVLVFVNLAFLSLGALLMIYGLKEGIVEFSSESGLLIKDVISGEMVGRKADELFPILALDYFPLFIKLFFVLGLIAAAYSSADSALAALTTSFCVDFLGLDKKGDSKENTRTRYMVHIGFSVIIFLVILIFKVINNQSVIAELFKAAGYTYGPLLGLFGFGLMTSRKVIDKWVPFICILSPILSYAFTIFAKTQLGYNFGFEILIFNGLLTFIGLFIISSPPKAEDLVNNL